MGKWLTWFEASLPPLEERDFSEIYEFGPPATADQIAEAERLMGVRWPDDLREMFMEFNGIRYTTKADRRGGHASKEFYLDAEAMSVKAPRYLRTSSDPLPSQDVLSKVAIVCQINGYGELYGLCLDDVAGHPAGAVVRLDHEVGQFEPCYPSLADFVRNGPVVRRFMIVAALAAVGLGLLRAAWDIAKELVICEYSEPWRPWNRGDAVRIRLDFGRLRTYDLSKDAVTRALEPSGLVGSRRRIEPPGVVFATRIHQREQYENIILKANAEGEIVRLKYVAKVEVDW
jgi:hypothetical protein